MREPVYSSGEKGVESSFTNDCLAPTPKMAAFYIHWEINGRINSRTRTDLDSSGFQNGAGRASASIVFFLSNDDDDNDAGCTG